MAAKPILLVEDDAVLRELFSQMLQQAGFPTVAFASARSALNAVCLDPPDLVVADWNTTVDGQRFATCLKLAAPAARLIIVSGDPARQIREASDADAVLEKPFTMNELVDAVRRFAPRE